MQSYLILQVPQILTLEVVQKFQLRSFEKKTVCFEANVVNFVFASEGWEGNVFYRCLFVNKGGTP